MKIEGLGEGHAFTVADRTITLDESMLKVGMETNQGAGLDPWIITDVLGDGKFKAVPKEVAKRRQLTGQNVDPRTEETFDISGKLDTENPIYKFYEKEVQRFLKNKYGAKMITDAQGVKWWQIDIKPEMAKSPIEAFGLTPLLFRDEVEEQPKDIE